MFARLYERAARCTGPIVPFHIGDTALPPPEQARMGSLGFTSCEDKSLYSYAAPAGDPPLLAALVDKLQRKNRMRLARPECVQITNGATHALSCATRVALDPGDEVLLLAPYWPLIRGIAASLGARPVEVTFSHRLLGDPELDVEAVLEEHITRNTAALYITNPNNPDGKVYSRAELEAVAAVARKHDLWVLSDEAYEEYVYDGREHVSIATLPGMHERTLTAFTFSKTYAMAGLRLGYLTGPASAIEAARKMANHSVYSVARAIQRAGLNAIVNGAPFVAAARERYRAARDRAHERIQVPCALPEGCTYLFLDFSQWVPEDEDTVFSLLETLAERGVLLAPGGPFGAEFAQWARLCFIAVDTAQLDRGIDVINEVVAELPRRR